MSARARLDPSSVEISVGLPVETVLTITNTGSVVDAYQVRMLGVDASWVQLSTERIQLFPGDSGRVEISVRLPFDYPAGERSLVVQVRSDLAPEHSTLLPLRLVLDEAPSLRLEVRPPQVFAGSKAAFAVTVSNDGNASSSVRLRVDDPEAICKVEFDQPELVVPPGEQRSTTMRVRGPRPWMGQPSIRTLMLGVDEGPSGLDQYAVFAQKPRITRILASLLGLLLAASVFGIVLSRNLGNVVEVTAVDDALLEQAFGDAGAAAGAAAGAVEGAVVARSSGAGIAGATVEVYRADDAAAPLRSVATGDDGTFAVDNLAAGPYRVRAVAAGFDARFFGDVGDFDNAADVTVEPGGTAGAVEIVLGGQPASIAGAVVGGAVEGAEVSLIVPAEATGGTDDAVLGIVEVDDTGAFSFEDVPAPAAYRLRVRKVGGITSQVGIEVAAGEARSGITLQLRTGDGVVAGIVSGPDGPVGAASIRLVSSSQEATTLSLTGESAGVFQIDGLLTPGSYGMTVTAEGFAPADLSVTLAPGQAVLDLVVTLQPATGRITGVVRDRAGVRLGGVDIVASDGTDTWSTSTLTIDDPSTPGDDRGTFLLTNLPSPAVFSVLAGGGAYAVVARDVVLTPAERQVDLVFDLDGATGVVTGRVADQGGAAVGGVTVTLSSGSASLTTTTATACVGSTTDCVGRYRFDGVEPGTYTLSFARPGSETVARQVRVEAGAQVDADVVLSPRAGITVVVCAAVADPVAATCEAGEELVGYQIRLWPEAAFPGGSPIAVAVSGADGTARFSDLDAPVRYVVEVADAPGGAGLTSVVVDLAASEVLTVAVLVP